MFFLYLNYSRIEVAEDDGKGIRRYPGLIRLLRILPFLCRRKKEDMQKLNTVFLFHLIDDSKNCLFQVILSNL